jgi:hypothetical protein
MINVPIHIFYAIKFSMIQKIPFKTNEKLPFEDQTTMRSVNIIKGNYALLIFNRI